MPDPQEFLPLTEAFYYILVALCREPAHGYAIMQSVHKMSAGRVVLGAGTLYTALNTLVKRNLIENAPAPAGADPRRKVYTITELGRKVLDAEVSRLEELVVNGKESLGLEGGRTYVHDSR